jgi:hypothetical protein
MAMASSLVFFPCRFAVAARHLMYFIGKYRAVFHQAARRELRDDGENLSLTSAAADTQ